VANISNKLEYWKARLLDLGKRNRLINCPLPKGGKRVSRTSLLIKQPSYSSLWDTFYDSGQSITFPVPQENTTPEEDDEYYEIGNGVLTDQTEKETHKTLCALMKKAKEFTEEKGLNALYLAFGFLEWKENGRDGIEMRSPLLLVPVTITQEDLFSPIVLSRLDEEISSNYCIDEKIKGDFGIDLPDWSDDKNFESYLSEIRSMVRPQGWSVSCDVTQLSLFSFMKINMYRDLERNATPIVAHPIVRALNGEALKINENISEISYINHDMQEPQEVFSVVDADSSQQDAITLAKRGVSFVLQGPPGTGKSQTITNIISELIADGKKVLFVSEKMAALEVVYKRLTAAGLGDFCLTLHSHNAKRREILDQFARSLKISRARASMQQDAFTKLYRLKETRVLLNKYSEELHTVVQPLGKTIYQINGKVSEQDSFPNIDYIQDGAETFTPEILAQCELALEELTRVVSKSGYQQNNPWNNCVLSETPTHTFRQQFSVDASKLASLLAEGISIAEQINHILGIQQDWSFEANSEVENITALLEISPNIPTDWLSVDLSLLVETLEKCLKAVELQKAKAVIETEKSAADASLTTEQQRYNEAYAGWQAAHAHLVATADENALSIDANALLGLYRNEYRTWLRGFIAGFRKAQKQLLSYRKTADKFSYADGLAMLDKIATVQALSVEAQKQLEVTQATTLRLQNAERSLSENISAYKLLRYDDLCRWLFATLGIEVSEDDLPILKQKADWANHFRTYSRKYTFGHSFVKAACSHNNFVLQNLKNLHGSFVVWQGKIKTELDKFSILFDACRKQTFYSIGLVLLNEQVLNCLNDFASLEYLVDYRNAKKKLSELGIGEYLAKAREVELSAENIIPVFKKCFYRSWLDRVIPQFSTINDFRRLRQDERIILFQGLDKSHMEISKAMLISKLISHLPNFDAFGNNGEVALLRREMAKQRKLMPTRKLIAALPNLLPTLKPCVMMSPLSVSTYLGESSFEFDTVVFDEASQVRTEDAIGAIFRAKQAIIAGDSKQLPPTDFFSSSMSGSDEYEEDEYGEINDTGAYESLLDEATLMPTQTLLWHYRSRHEHLIAFSNAKIYQGNLITFPSSVEKLGGMGVEYVYVPGGTYDRGGKNGNKAEAKQVAELVFEHFKTFPNRSLGIIAFGEVQQSAIQNAIIEMRKANPTFEPFFKEDKEDAMFIKNLETVQGDERDTIIFSIGYAPDTNGKFIMNFGPLSRNGGERRLNVAVTRSRYNLKLVGSILPTDINADKTSGQGPKLLRLYIDFAINGTNAIMGEISASDELWFDSPFETSVYNFLTENGYDVATQVGCSGYRIDLAVRHPQYNGRFAIGIECDGAMYHTARTARERDRLRQTVLEDMGWKIYRIWSTDWIKDRNTEGQRLLEAVKEAIENYREEAPSKVITTEEKASDFLNITTVSADESVREGVQEKFNAVRSRYYGCQAREILDRDIEETMLRVLVQNFGLDQAGLFKETALYGYGWTRQGSAIKQKFEQAFASLLRKGRIEVDSLGKIKTHLSKVSHAQQA
jgi:superfamily I DNA and/or RNA helicase/very-short-patch-repair endonuclease